MDSEQNQKSVIQKLTEFAQILEGEPLPAIVERRANDLKDGLAALYGESKGTELADFLKSAAWLIGCMTIEGRAHIIVEAKRAAVELNDKHGTDPPVTWHDIARLPTFDRDGLNRAAGQLRHLAGLLSDRKTGTIPSKEGSENAEEYDNKIYSPKELRNLFSISQTTLVNWIKDGRIRAIKITPKKYRIHKKDLPTT